MWSCLLLITLYTCTVFSRDGQRSLQQVWLQNSKDQEAMTICVLSLIVCL